MNEMQGHVTSMQKTARDSLLTTKGRKVTEYSRNSNEKQYEKEHRPATLLVPVE